MLEKIQKSLLVLGIFQGGTQRQEFDIEELTMTLNVQISFNRV